MNKLLAQLAICEKLLRSVEETFWADKIEFALNEWKKSDEGQLTAEVLGWFGGMGSFNDLIISPLNRHVVADHEEGNVNNKLNSIRSEIYYEAKRLASD